MNESDININEKILHRELLYSGRIFELMRYDCELPNGSIASRDVLVHNGACAILAERGGKIAFVRQYRCAIERVMLELPAGKLDYAEEDRLQCARRELREETGLTAENWEFLLDFYPAAGYSSEKISLYHASGLSDGDSDFDDDENLELCWLTLSEAMEMIRNSEIHDSKTVMGILFYSAKVGYEHGK